MYPEIGPVLEEDELDGGGVGSVCWARFTGGNRRQAAAIIEGQAFILTSQNLRFDYGEVN